jgi:hypothetical protein
MSGPRSFHLLLGLPGNPVSWLPGLTSPIGAGFEIALPRCFSAEIDAFYKFYKPIRSQLVG